MTTQPHLFEDLCDYEPFFDPIEFADAHAPTSRTPTYCPLCNGSGEGPCEGTKCRECGGCGEV